MLTLDRLIEYVFFFGLMGMVGYLLWLMFTPFITALALAAVIVTICYPIYERVLTHTPWRNKSLAAFFSTLIVLLIVVIPIFWISSILIGEAASIYHILGNGEYSLSDTLNDFEGAVQTIVPGLQLDMNSYLRQGAEWAAGNLGAVFAGTASTAFSFFIAIFGCFYFFRDGRRFTEKLIRISPLADKEDALIIKRMSLAVRGVAVGTVLVAIIQGVSTAIGFSIFGFDRAVLFGVIVALFGLVPGLGPSVVFLPAVGYLAFTGDYFGATGLIIWFLVAVSLIDNILGPYLMSRAHPMHPFLVLLSVIGGIILLGPIGFVVGPVITSVFIVLLEIYAQYIAPDKRNSGI